MGIVPPAASRRTRLLEWAERRLPALTRYARNEPLPIHLTRRRIYVLPTRFGLLFTAVVLTMLLGALNYNNNPALLLACLLGCAGYQSLFGAFGALNHLRLCGIRADACHAGARMRLLLKFDIAGRARRSVQLQSEGQAIDFNLDGTDTLEWHVPATRRGWLRPGRMRLSSEYPFGLFHAWSWIYPRAAFLVYPTLETQLPPLPEAAGAAASARPRAGGEEWAGLRDYRRSDPVRHIAWKASARNHALLVREFERPQADEVVLDEAALGALDREARISRLAGWVIAAEMAQRVYTLRLGGTRIGPGLGATQRDACLRALALAPGAAP